MIVSETLNFDGLAGAISEMDLHNLLQAYPPLEYVYFSIRNEYSANVHVGL